MYKILKVLCAKINTFILLVITIIVKLNMLRKKYLNRTCVLYGGRKEEKYLGDLILPKNKILGD